MQASYSHVIDRARAVFRGMGPFAAMGAMIRGCGGIILWDRTDDHPRSIHPVIPITDVISTIAPPHSP
jgi:hypothetical protein